MLTPNPDGTFTDENGKVWRLVPAEPTEAMLSSVIDKHLNGDRRVIQETKIARWYGTMLSAAPPPPTSVDGKVWKWVPVEADAKMYRAGLRVFENGVFDVFEAMALAAPTPPTSVTAQLIAKDLAETGMSVTMIHPKDFYKDEKDESVETMIAEAVKAEREECAKACEALDAENDKPTDRLIGYAECVAAIRARNQQPVGRESDDEGKI